MRSQKIKGIIINKRSLGEKDYAITVLTPDFGKIQCIAKGARNIKSKFTGHVDLLNVCDFEIYSGPGNTIITECQVQKNYASFRKDLKKFFFASLISKILYKYTTENENSEDIYDLTLNSFNSVEEFTKEELIFEAFKIKLCELIGLMPDSESIETMKLSVLNDDIKGIISYMQVERYKNISNLKLNKEELEKLKKTTQEILEFSI